MISINIGSKLILLFLAIYIIYSVVYYTSTRETIVIRLKDKETIFYDDRTLDNYIYTDNEIFKNEDDLILGKFSSFDLQNRLDYDQNYVVTVIGWYIPPMFFRNIIEVKKIKAQNYEERF